MPSAASRGEELRSYQEVHGSLVSLFSLGELLLKDILVGLGRARRGGLFGRRGGGSRSLGHCDEGIRRTGRHVLVREETEGTDETEMNGSRDAADGEETVRRDDTWWPGQK